jgi:FAD:protein FMN transferase
MIALRSAQRFTLSLPQCSLCTLWFKLLLIVSLLGVTGCAKKDPLYQQQSYVFGTLVEISIYGEPEARARQLAKQVFADFDKLHEMLHAWKPGTLARMNQILAQSPARAAIAPGMIDLLQDATRYSEMSHGLFNPAIGKLVKLWGFHADTFQPVRPDENEIARLVKANPQMRDIVIEGIEFHSKNPDAQLDLGGYAKGYALDVAADYLRAQGVKGALINIGGNIIAIGQHGDRPWRVGIQHPRAAGAIAALDLHDGEAIGTSGDYQRYFTLDGQRYCHLIDPRNGHPVQGIQAVTVLVPKRPKAGTLSDVASKPVFIAGLNGWRQAAQDMGVSNVMLIDGKGEVYLTQAMQQRLNFITQPTSLHPVP